MRDESYVWILCNNPGERERIRTYLVQKEYTLVVESDRKRFFGKFGSKDEKEKWKAENKEDTLFKKKPESEQKPVVEQIDEL